MQKIKIQSQTVYILSGISFSGKSYFTKQLLNAGLSKDSIISADTIRENILGFSEHIDDNGSFHYLYGWENETTPLWDILMKTYQIRLQQGLPVVIDATNLTDADRKPFVDLATKYHRKSEVIILDFSLDEILQRSQSRELRFFDTSSVLKKQAEKFQKTSRYAHQILSLPYEIQLLPSLLETTNIDVIGDIHGLKKEFLDMIEQLGWFVEDNQLKNRDGQKILLSLGDVLDRGPDGLEIIKLFMNSPQVIMLHGNHEEKLINKYEHYIHTETIQTKSISSSLTFKKLLDETPSVQAEIINYLKKNEFYKALWIDAQGQVTQDESVAALKIAFMHADVKYFNPYKTIKGDLIYGKKILNKRIDLEIAEDNNDNDYQRGYDNQINQYVVLRGHVKGDNQLSSIFSLEDNQAFKGNLVICDVDKMVYLWTKSKKMNSEIFKECTMKYKTNYDFNEVVKEQIELMKGLNELHKLGLVSDGERKNEDGSKIKNPFGFKIYKYSKKVFFKKLWKKYPLLEKARGIVLDSTGEIIVHPFDKIYNYEEYDTAKDLLPSQKVKVVEKMNGFLGCISLNPINKKLIYSTTGSLSEEAPFNQFIKDCVSPELKEKLEKYLKNNSLTLMFEVIHPEDPHVISYSKEQMGLYLIGVRGKKISDQPWNEEKIDELAQNLGLRRPWHKEMLFGDLLEELKTMEIEGVMVRDVNTQQTLAKIKTDYYLTSKFLGRMSPKMVEEMYQKPDYFKANKVDEEYFHIVDHIVAHIPQNDFINMEQTQRVQTVRGIIDKTRKNLKSTTDLEVKSPKLR